MHGPLSSPFPRFPSLSLRIRFGVSSFLSIRVCVYVYVCLDIRGVSFILDFLKYHSFTRIRIIASKFNGSELDRTLLESKNSIKKKLSRKIKLQR